MAALENPQRFACAITNVVEISEALTITIQDFERDQVAQAIISQRQAKLMTEAVQHGGQCAAGLRAKIAVLKKLVHHAPPTMIRLVSSQPASPAELPIARRGWSRNR